VLLSPEQQQFSIVSFKQSIFMMDALTALLSFIFTVLWKTDGIEIMDDEPTDSIESSASYKIAR
jgi:hypothetical protein